MSYYKQKQTLALVNKDDQIVGQSEKWQAHKNGLLHRGFTAILFYKEFVLLQHRKHLVFDDVYDLTFSSHPVYYGENLQESEKAVVENLKREWLVDDKSYISRPKLINKIYYKAVDKKNGYIEHEIDYVFQVELNKLPEPNLDYSYGYLLEKKKNLSSIINRLSSSFLAPWVKKMGEEGYLFMSIKG